MSYRVEHLRGGGRSGRGGRGLVSSLVTLAVAGTLAGAWACAPRSAAAPVPAVAPQGFVAAAVARPLAPPQPLRLG
ncbi:MAG TPA: hypothetical protein VHG51_19235, partial [Longimicrobiaceae bacterium]|nr:hypothetical protein [Longimicrobiaceae bacterium]